MTMTMTMTSPSASDDPSPPPPAPAPAPLASNLNSLLDQVRSSDLKFIFVGGKGGVGKTTSSSAIATLLASPHGGGKRVLLVSTDPAHSLGDAFRMEFSGVPQSPLGMG